jgi:hypothetical protein
MSSILSSHQPNFLPNLGFFHKMAQAELFILITNLQFERQEGWQRRNLFKNANGDMWLTVPVLGSQNQKINEVKIKYERDWCKKHRRSLWLNYGESPGRNFLSKIDKIYDERYETLSDLNIRLIKTIKDILGITTPLIVDEEVSGEKHEFIINICKKHGGVKYLSGRGARSYLTDDLILDLKKNGIAHQFVDDGPLATNYPYSALHYILTKGVEETMKLIEKPITVSQKLVSE